MTSQSTSYGSAVSKHYSVYTIGPVGCEERGTREIARVIYYTYCRRLIDENKIISIALPYYKRHFSSKFDRLFDISTRFNIKSGTPKKGPFYQDSRFNIR